MKRTTLFTVMMISAMLAVTVLAANSRSADGKVDSSQAAKPALHHQTHCPVMGGEIDSTYYTDIQGQRVYHCCAMCAAKLKADPDKYFQKAAAEGVLFENIQTDCPVSHDTLQERNIFADYEGRRLFFCSEKCRTDFARDPQKYLQAMDGAAKTDSKNPMPGMKMDHGAMHHDTTSQSGSK